MNSDMRVGVVGTGYVGLTTAVCLSGHRGADTVAVDIDRMKVDRLSAGVAVLDEPGLARLLTTGTDTGTLRFSTDFAALADRDVVFVCVPTPQGNDGASDLRALDDAVGRLAGVLRPGAVIAVKSTVPVGTTRRFAWRLAFARIGVVSSPEFLREGHAVADFVHPDRIVVGALADRDADQVCAAYGDIGPLLRMSPESAELAKYASNAFLAVKLSYANSIASLCARLGADIGDVIACMGADDRIGPSFLQPGPGWGGSCLPKDTAALVHTARSHDVLLGEVEAARVTNAAQTRRIGNALREALGSGLTGTRITALGLTFKAATSDTRDSPALAVCAHLAAEGAVVSGYDPRLPAIDPDQLERARVTAVDDPYRAAKSADAIVVLTEWPEFGDLDWSAIADHAPGAVVVDTRRLLDPGAVRSAGLGYLGSGCPDGF
ncbi:UDP-glucose/GDP-mannose dehydrogenase family protein [Mycobacterium sp. ITM-2016-00317]|uniref:UDP-glucose dehydrogenase family protein n=1 Tax=Mycobacterium sp. ITM-2016-00317 TaxID=2099694 RepID=UPI000D482C6B|nr:UDP-glucose/GDP-mannose dehydrogenase family protein [Mycobacterium sp. ITM-2016-00317]WNG90124.1 UDP-glucose/GDP-mannose dehydrogenase family protein [Mycobacterium sp. ITM-2016-00317]